MSYMEPKYHVERINGERRLVCADERTAHILKNRASFRGQQVKIVRGESRTFTTIEEGNRGEFPMRPVFFVVFQ